MPINDDLSGFEALVALADSLSEHESQPPRYRGVTNMRKKLPPASPGGTPPGTCSGEDTPVYWQTVQAMASGMWQRDR
jgi:hypothetical protein